jgi:hypothetical protein
MMMPVIKQPISRVVAMATRSATYTCAPKLRSWTAPMKARMSPTRKLINDTIGRALGPHAWMMPARSIQRKFARPLANRTNASAASPRNRRNARPLSPTARAARPTRASHAACWSGLASSFSGTAVASAIRRLRPCGSPSRSTVSPRRSPKRSRRKTNEASEVSQSGTPRASSTIRRTSGLCATACSIPSADGSRSCSRHGPVSRTQTVSRPIHSRRSMPPS